MSDTRDVVGILGGRGKMGAWFARALESFAAEILVADLHSELTAEELIDRSEVVIVSLPIGETCSVLAPLIPRLRPEQLVMDLTSVKAQVAELLLRSRAEVCSIHPMFGPQAESLRGQTIVVCELRPGPRAPRLLDFFEQAGAALHKTTPAAHDRMMAVVQGLNHFCAITMAHCLMKAGFDVSDSLNYMSPIYRIRMDLVGRILAQEPRLYGEIAILNPETGAALQCYLESAAELMALIERGDLPGFEQYFSQAAGYLGSFKEAALAESNELVKAVCRSAPEPQGEE